MRLMLATGTGWKPNHVIDEIQEFDRRYFLRIEDLYIEDGIDTFDRNLAEKHFFFKCEI